MRAPSACAIASGTGAAWRAARTTRRAAARSGTRRGVRIRPERSRRVDSLIVGLRIGARRARARLARTWQSPSRIPACARSHHAQHRFEDRIGSPARGAHRGSRAASACRSRSSRSRPPRWCRRSRARLPISAFVSSIRAKRLGDLDDLRDFALGAAPVRDRLVGEPLRVRRDDADAPRAQRLSASSMAALAVITGRPARAVSSRVERAVAARQQPVRRAGQPDRDRRERELAEARHGVAIEAEVSTVALLERRVRP